MENSTVQNRVCSHRHAFSLNNFFRRLVQQPNKIVGPYITPGDTVIDLGCGPGFFTIPILEMTGETGKVIAVDLQIEMLDILAGKLFDTSLAHCVSLHQCRKNSLDLDLTIQANFMLAYYMVHETPDQETFFREVLQVLRPGGKLLVVEPPFHVSKKRFKQSQGYAEKAGFRVVDTPKKKGGMSMLLSH